MLKQVLVAALAASILAGCGKSGSSSGGGASSGGGGSSSPKTPEQFFEVMKEATIKGDSAAMWGMLSKNSQKWFVKSMDEMKESTKSFPDENLAKMAEEYGMSVADFKAADGEKLAKAMIAQQGKDPKEQEKAKKSSFVKADVQGDKAVCETKKHDGSPEWIVLVKEGGEWKFDIEESDKVDKEKKKDTK